MRIFLIHPEDDPGTDPWANSHWDRVIDLGLAGTGGYARWSTLFQCPISTLNSLRDGFVDFYRVRELLGLGCDQLVDEHGLDWWEIISILLTGEVDTLILLRRFANSVGAGDTLYVSRPGLHASILQCLLLGRVHVFTLSRNRRKNSLAHYVRVFRKLSSQQIVDVFWDKCDSGYQFRGRLTTKPAPSKRPVVLLPTAYVNVSRTGIAYANTFPDENFLLVATRRSGWVGAPPNNVTAAWLSDYAVVRDRRREFEQLERRWQVLRNLLIEEQEFEILNQLGCLDGVSQRILRGLEVRDAWRNVLDSEPVQGVLCADDSNPYTRIPLLLGKARGLVNIACHHGALDSRYVFKRAHGDVIWVKGKMEEDYLVRRCKVPAERIEIAAPALPADWQESEHSNRDVFRPCLLFISEAADVSGGRSEEFYRDILPSLADLALATGRKLIVKLHPAESKSERTRAVGRILSAEQKAVTRILSGPLTERLLEKTWFGITILSTVAIECAVRGIPCFLCEWLEFWPYGYVEQFLRYGVGIGLKNSSEIQKIPEYLTQYRIEQEVKENCWQTAAPGRFRDLLSSSFTRSQQRTERVEQTVEQGRA